MAGKPNGPKHKEHPRRLEDHVLGQWGRPLISVEAGARRFAHTALLRADRSLHALSGIERFPIDDKIRNLFKRFRRGLVVRFYEPLWAWQLARVPQRAGGYIWTWTRWCSSATGNGRG